MSRVECDHCGARYGLEGEASVADQADSGQTVTCRECGAPARKALEDNSMTPTPIAAMRETMGSGNASDGDPQQEEPPTARSPATFLADALEDEKTVALPVSAAAAAAEEGKAADEGAEKPSKPVANEADEAAPISLTPSMDALIRRVQPEHTRRPTAAKGKGDGFLESSGYDLRPPDIQVELSRSTGSTPPTATRTIKTDAPVAGTRRPPADAKPSSRSGLFIGLVLSAGILFVAVRGMRNEPELPSLPAAPPTLEAATGSIPERPTEPVETGIPLEAPPAQASTATAADASAAAAAVPTSPPLAMKERAAPSSVQRPSPKTDAAVVPASLTERAEPPAVEDAAPPEAAFDANAASSALDGAVAQASTCRKAGDPSGTATVTITFSPSGRVTTATISGPPFAGTETGSCIASRLRSARVPIFSGDFVTVRKTVTIQ